MIAGIVLATNGGRSVRLPLLCSPRSHRRVPGGARLRPALSWPSETAALLGVVDHHRHQQFPRLMISRSRGCRGRRLCGAPFQARHRQ
jgi:hypothetical protein